MKQVVVKRSSRSETKTLIGKRMHRPTDWDQLSRRIEEVDPGQARAIELAKQYSKEES